MAKVLSKTLATALDHYENWVLLKFKKFEFELNDGSNLDYVLELVEEKILKIDCTSMLVEGMTIDLMKRKLTDMSYQGLLVFENKSSRKSIYYKLTPQGNLTALQRYGKILKYDDYVEKEIPKNAPNFIKSFFEKLRSQTKNMNTREVRLLIMDEILLNFDIYLYLENFFKLVN